MPRQNRIPSHLRRQGCVSLPALRVGAAPGMKRAVIFVWLVVFIGWLAWTIGGQQWFIEARKTLFHHCRMEWRGPAGALEEYAYVCTENQEVQGTVYRNGGGTYH